MLDSHQGQFDVQCMFDSLVEHTHVTSNDGVAIGFSRFTRDSNMIRWKIRTTTDQKFST